MRIAKGMTAIPQARGGRSLSGAGIRRTWIGLTLRTGPSSAISPREISTVLPAALSDPRTYTCRVATGVNVYPAYVHAPPSRHCARPILRLSRSTTRAREYIYGYVYYILIFLVARDPPPTRLNCDLIPGLYTVSSPPPPLPSVSPVG